MYRYDDIIASQRAFFSSEKTRDINYRIDALKKLKASIIKNEDKIAEAIWMDLHKSPQETYLTEIRVVKEELKKHISCLKKWSRPQKVHTPIELMPAKSRIISEPLGIVLIIAPWNYPFQLLINPLVGAISAGNCAVLKASPYTMHVADVLESLISEIFPPEYITLLKGNREVNKELLDRRFDFIFFTGSPSLGRIVMEAASKNLTPLVLELGGKSPCIVDKDANLDIAAHRMAWGKLINAGQTCIAPDYFFFHSSIKSALVEKLKNEIQKLYRGDMKENKLYPRIVSDKAFSRLELLMKDGNIVYGGETDRKEKYISPTIIDNVKPEYPIMQEEIFGPLFPIMTFDDIDEVVSFINNREKPLALYYFGKESKARNVLGRTTSGGACINDIMMHVVSENLPFGGVGNSGMGKYHGKESFDLFSNKRSVFFSSTAVDAPFKYPPFKYFKLTRKL